MTTYTAPVRDMKFVLNEVVGLSEVSALPGYEDATADLVESVLEEAAKFAEGVVAPTNWTGDQEGAQFQEGGHVLPATGFAEAYQQFVENGWNGLACDPEYGGQGLPHLVSTAVFEMWHAANMSFALCPMLTQGAIEAISRHGSTVQKELYLPNLISGEWTGTMNLTEPQAGSDLSAIRSKAIPEGDHYRISGQKIFITWGEHNMTDNIIHLVLARLPDAPAGVKGISLFIVPKFLVNEDGSLGERNDVQCVSIEHKLGIHGSPTAVLAFGDNEGAIGYLVGEANKGLMYMFTMMNHARHAVGLEGVAISERAYQLAVSYAKERVQAKVIIQHPDVRRMLMTMKAQTEAMRAVAYYASACLDKAHAHPDPAEKANAQALADLLIPVVKGWSTERSVDVTSLGIQVHGGMGYVEETGAAQHFRDARITPIYEGTTAIQANDLTGRKIGREAGKTAYAFITEMQAVQEKVAAVQGDAAFTSIAESLKDGIAAVKEGVDWIVANFESQPHAVSGAAVPFLFLFGAVAGGYMLARSALAAKRLLAEDSEADASFLTAKIGTAHFYAEHLLPMSEGYKRIVVKGTSSIHALTDDQF